MKTTIFDLLDSASFGSERIFSVLVDPEKSLEVDVSAFAKAIKQTFLMAEKNFGATQHLILVGGSSVTKEQLNTWMTEVRPMLPWHVVLFPGAGHQVHCDADAIFFISLLSGDNSDFLIKEQRIAAREVRDSGIESIPTAYLLIDGGRESSIQKVTGTKPLDQDNVQLITDTVIAAELMGFQSIYLEAGSGARFPINSEVIRQVNDETNLPLIVGGGLRTREQIATAYDAGADMVVVGTALEEDSSWANNM